MRASASHPALSLFSAVTRGVKCPRTNTRQGVLGDKLYLVDKKTKHVLVEPDESRADLERDAQARTTLNADRIVTVPQGVTLVRAEQDNRRASRQPLVRPEGPDGARRQGHQEPRAELRQRGGGTGAPNVRFDFTGRGASTWETFTKKLAQRGQEQALGTCRDASNQHFAIVLDDELISAPQIPSAETPNGLPSGGGSEISGGFTIETAQRLASLLKPRCRSSCS